MPQTATNPKTGERVVLVGGQWVPISRTATNPKTGERRGLAGNQWVSLEQPQRPTQPVPSPEADRARQGVLAQIEQKKREIASFENLIAQRSMDPTELYRSIGSAEEDIKTLQNQLAYIAQRGKAPPAPTAGTYARQLKEIPSTVYQAPGQILEGLLGLAGSGLQTAGRSNVGRAALGLATLPLGLSSMALAPKEGLRTTGEALSRAGTRAEKENRLQAEAIFGKPSEEAQYYPGVRRAQQLAQGIGSTIPFIATEGAAGVLGAAGKVRTAARAAKALEAVEAAGGAGAAAVPAVSRLERAAELTRGAQYPMAGAQGSQQAGQQAQQFREQGGQVSPEQEFLVRLGGAGLGLTEVGVIRGMVEGLPPTARGAAIDRMSQLVERATLRKVAPKALFAELKNTVEGIESRAVGRIALSGAHEAVQEGGTQFGQNVLAQQVYNPNQDLMEGVGESALIGGLVGGGVRGGTEAVLGVTGRGRDAELQKQQQALLQAPSLATVELALPDPKDPAVVARVPVDIIGYSVNDKPVVRYPDGRIQEHSMEDLEAMRVPEGAFYPSSAFNKEMVSGRLQAAAGDNPNFKTQSFVNALDQKLNTDIALGRIDESADYVSDLEKRFSGVKRRQAQQQFQKEGLGAVEDPTMRAIFEAKSIINDYRVEYAKSRAQPGANVGEGAPSTRETISQMLQREQENERERERLRKFGPQQSIEEQLAAREAEKTLWDVQTQTPVAPDIAQQRYTTIDQALTDPLLDVDKRVEAANAALAEQGMDPLTPQEQRRIRKRYTAERAFEPELDQQQAERRQTILDTIMGDESIPDKYRAFTEIADELGLAPPTETEFNAMRGDAAALEAMIRAREEAPPPPLPVKKPAAKAPKAAPEAAPITEAPASTTTAPQVDRMAMLQEANARYPDNDLAATAFYNGALGAPATDYFRLNAEEDEWAAYNEGLRLSQGEAEAAPAAPVVEAAPAKAPKAKKEKQAKPAPEPKPEKKPEVKVTKVEPGEAYGARPVQRGTQGIVRGRPVEGAAELTPGMQAQQKVTENLNNLRSNNRLTDSDVAAVLRQMRPPRSKAEMEALPKAQQERWQRIEALTEDMEAKAEQRDEAEGKDKKRLAAAVKELDARIDEVREDIARYARADMIRRSTNLQTKRNQIEADYKAGKITSRERSEKLRELRIERNLFPILAMRSDAATQALFNEETSLTPHLEEDVAEGPEQIAARLDKAVKDGDITEDEAAFTKWLLDQNPNVARYARFFVSQRAGQTYQGAYDPLNRLIELVAKARGGTAVHEILHHAERLMPQSAQRAIDLLWEQRFKLRRRVATGDDKLFLDALHEYYFGNGDEKNLTAARMLLSSNGNFGAPSGLSKGIYQYYSPSEFWAVNATDILRQRFNVKDDVLARIRQWLKEFASHVAAFVGIPSRSMVIRKLNQLANTDGKSKSSGLIAGNEGPAFMTREMSGSPKEGPAERGEPISNELLQFISKVQSTPNVPATTRAGDALSLQDIKDRLIKAQSTIIRKVNYDLQDAVDIDNWLAKQYGVDRLPENMSLQTKAELLKSSRSGRQLLLDRNYIEPIIQKMIDLDVDAQDIGMYLWARSAKDRNALVRKRNGEFPESGSGMTDAEADAIIKEFTSRGLKPKLDVVAKMHDRMVDYMLNVRVQEGLLTRKQAQAARADQPLYAALKGYAEDGDMQDMGDPDAHEEANYRANMGIRRSEYMKTQGRKTMPFNPLFTLFADAKQLVHRTGENRVGVRLLENIMQDPDLFEGVAHYYTDADPKIRRVPNENAEYPDGTPVRDNMRMKRGEFLVVKKDGVPYYIEFADTDAGKSLRRLFQNMKPNQLGMLAQQWVKAANTLKSTMTRYNPNFIPKAYMRDAQDAVAKAFAAETDNASPAFGKKLGAAVAANMTMATEKGRLINGAVARFVAGTEPKTNEQAEMSLLLQQMMEDGGAPGHAVIHDLERLTDDAQKKLREAKALKDKDPVAFAKKYPKAVLAALDAASQFTDIKARLATYVAALDAGIDRDGSARLALNSSLNLTRRGEWATTLDSVFFFWSPAVESLRQQKRMVLNSKNGRRVIYAQMAIGAAIAAFNMMMGSGDDDEDGRTNYEDIPDSVKQSSLVIMTGPGADDYVYLPLGFMLSFPTYVGQKMTEAGSGLISSGAATMSMMDSLRGVAAGAFTTFSPVKPQGADTATFIGSFVPNLAKPWVEAYVLNQNAFGSPISTPNISKDRSNVSLGREDTGRVWKWIAQSLNDVSGGKGTVSGGIDTTPEALRHIFESYAGGLYRFGEDSYKLVAEEAKPDETVTERLPIVRSFVGKGARFAPMNQYIKNTGQLMAFPGFQSQPDMDQVLRQEKHEPEQFVALTEAYPLRTDPEIVEAYREAKKELDRIGRDQREELVGTDDPAARKDILEQYRTEKDEIYKQFNRTYNEVAKRYR